MMKRLIEPYGNELIELVVAADELPDVINEAAGLPSLQLSERAVCDLELLACGGFSPLRGFMNKVDYESVLAEMRLGTGQVFPVPVTLPVEAFAGLALDKNIALRDGRNNLLAIMSVEEIYEWSKSDFSQNVLGAQDLRHPLITELQHWCRLNIAGRLRVVNLPKHPDFQDLRLTPRQTRTALGLLKSKNIVAFQTRNLLSFCRFFLPCRQS